MIQFPVCVFVVFVCLLCLCVLVKLRWCFLWNLDHNCQVNLVTLLIKARNTLDLGTAAAAAAAVQRSLCGAAGHR